jgi:hypothetical protein
VVRKPEREAVASETTKTDPKGVERDRADLGQYSLPEVSLNVVTDLAGLFRAQVDSDLRGRAEMAYLLPYPTKVKKPNRDL